ncbi:hypothetical protein [Waltera intestinalis]|uniref:hypothetical protein n=1 Tax=Waltera intestinalis TaxID=2606635 RepID=UPI00197B6949|nr:hypothetical protein [Waltera intestinalis]
MGDVMEQELVELGLHRENLYKRQHDAYEQEERNNGELRSTGTAADRKDHL